MTEATERFTFFARADSVFSQWYPAAPFVLGGQRYATAEHFMMLRKAEVFDAPHHLRRQILRAAHPRIAKALGRSVPRFDDAVWRKAARPIVAEGNRAKFSQNPAALRALLATEGTTLVEAAPWDRIWGIGLAAEDPRAARRETWLGSNWLGEVLTEVRESLLQAKRASGGG